MERFCLQLGLLCCISCLICSSQLENGVVVNTSQIFEALFKMEPLGLFSGNSGKTGVCHFAVIFVPYCFMGQKRHKGESIAL